MQKGTIRIIEYLFVIILVFNCNSIWTSYEETSFNRILKIILTIITFLYVANYHQAIPVYRYKNVMSFILIAVFYILIYAAVVDYRVDLFFSFIFGAFCIFLFVVVAGKNGHGIGLLCKYENVMVAVAIVSLFFWIFGSLLGLLHPTGYVYSTWTGNFSLRAVPTYYHIYFEPQSIGGLARNCAFFTEAPMYNFHLCIALLIDLFCRQKLSVIKCTILTVSVLTTVATTGYCLMVIAYMLKYIFSGNVKGYLMMLKVMIIPVILLIGINLLQTMILDKLSDSSGAIRADDFVAGYRAWQRNIIWGAGYGNGEYVRNFMSSFRSNNLGYSNSVMTILYQGGLYLALPYIFFIYRWIKTCIKRKDAQWFFFFACFLFVFAITTTAYKLLSIFILMAYDFTPKYVAKIVTKQKRPILNDVAQD